jgi:hypothetical protein
LGGLALWLNATTGATGALQFGLIVWLVVSFLCILLSVLVDALLGRLVNEQIEETTRPNQRLELTIRNGLFVFVSSTLIGGLIGELLDRSIDFLLAGLFFGWFFGLYYGGIAFIQHQAMRFVLTRAKLLPRRLIPFLDYCTELIFLRRVGGGYIFVHRLLMEHFAAMYSENDKAPSFRRQKLPPRGARGL